MIFEIHENYVIGKLYYDRIQVIKSGAKIGLSYEDVILFLAKENHLKISHVYDIFNDRLCFKLSGSVTNMLRFRNELKTLFDLTEDAKKENYANL